MTIWAFACTLVLNLLPDKVTKQSTNERFFVGLIGKTKIRSSFPALHFHEPK